RANAGKTTILQKVLKSDIDMLEVFDGKGNKVKSHQCFQCGYHSIEHELVFQGNPGFVFHDSCGFKVGTAQQFDQMKNFVVDHAAMARSVNKHIHAIWYCIPMTESCRTVIAAEEKFFNECDTGYVPVIVLLTKVDALNIDAIQELEDEGIEVTQEKVSEKERGLLEKWLAHIKNELDKCKFPPRGYLSLQNMHQENADSSALMKCTADVLNEEGLQKLLISTQQSSIALCVVYAVQK
ncbi:GTP-binding protein, partial [Pisolithus orientalis]|uniref:GTP-binding protein n=1 Tax=Pisolithus orientalis TaxID=936130 RepID=UPI002223F713